MKKHHLHGPTSKFQPRPLDEDMFFELFDILHDGCMEGNWSATARVLALAPQTLRKWSKQAPKDPWINHILAACINEIYQSMIHSKHKKIRKRAEKVKGQLHRSNLHTLKDYLGYNEDAQDGLQRELLVLMHNESSMSLSDLRKPANLGGFSERAIRGAADSIGLIREVTGFGDKKQVSYRMPTQKDLT